MNDIDKKDNEINTPKITIQSKESVQNRLNQLVNLNKGIIALYIALIGIYIEIIDNVIVQIYEYKIVYIVVFISQILLLVYVVIIHYRSKNFYDEILTINFNSPEPTPHFDLSRIDSHSKVVEYKTYWMILPFSVFIFIFFIYVFGMLLFEMISVEFCIFMLILILIILSSILIVSIVKIIQIIKNQMDNMYALSHFVYYVKTREEERQFWS